MRRIVWISALLGALTPFMGYVLLTLWLHNFFWRAAVNGAVSLLWPSAPLWPYMAANLLSAAILSVPLYIGAGAVLWTLTGARKGQD